MPKIPLMQIPPMPISTQFRASHLKLIAAFAYQKILKGNIVLIALAGALEIFSRFLSLFGFWVTFQAIVAAVRPEIIVHHANKAIHWLGLGIRLDRGNVELAIIALLMFIYLANYLNARIIYIIYSAIYDRCMEYRNLVSGNASIDDETLLMGKMADLITSVIMLMGTSGFTLLIIVFLFAISPFIGVLMLVMMAFLVGALVMSDRSNLRSIHAQSEAQKSYVNVTDEKARTRRRDKSADIPERRLLVEARKERARRTIVKPQMDQVLGAIILSITVYFLFQADLSPEKLVGLIAIFVVGVRNAISTGRQMSTHLSRILELRQNTPVIKRMLADPAPRP